ncbi:hypothetical protein LB505_005509 [Fusarium chuoi]|nr:hypothetical protein LB505_005509 [Fusarium chuoi]
MATLDAPTMTTGRGIKMATAAIDMPHRLPLNSRDHHPYKLHHNQQTLMLHGKSPRLLTT